MKGVFAMELEGVECNHEFCLYDEINEEFIGNIERGLGLKEDGIHSRHGLNCAKCFPSHDEAVNYAKKHNLIAVVLQKMTVIV